MIIVKQELQQQLPTQGTLVILKQEQKQQGWSLLSKVELV